ncbi:hypothetical protein [Bacteroides sp.]|uniref:hypothetical protein n=1 Tax=Bacteroides sp. TaxID=29523 RepID=UPI002FC9A1DE
MKYVWIICLMAICSCNTVKDDLIVDENYEKLFPLKEIEKPENKRGELNVQLCDPSQALKDYKYPGMETPNDAEQYKVTLTCTFQEKGSDNSLIEDINSVYEVRYINEREELVIISCGKKSERNMLSGQPSPNKMYNGEPLVITYTVHSGFPLYLAVSGAGPRGSNIKASIKAVSSDGLIEIPNLETEQYQNKEGIIGLRYPYCEYMILP